METESSSDLLRPWGQWLFREVAPLAETERASGNGHPVSSKRLQGVGSSGGDGKSDALGVTALHTSVAESWRRRKEVIDRETHQPFLDVAGRSLRLGRRKDRYHRQRLPTGGGWRGIAPLGETESGGAASRFQKSATTVVGVSLRWWRLKEYPSRGSAT